VHVQLWWWAVQIRADAASSLALGGVMVLAIPPTPFLAENLLSMHLAVKLCELASTYTRAVCTHTMQRGAARAHL
jgi:hypothetical protein